MNPLEGQKEKMEVSKDREILPARVMQNPCLPQFPDFLGQTICKLRETDAWLQGSCPGIPDSLGKTLADTGLGGGHMDRGLSWLAR